MGVAGTAVAAERGRLTDAGGITVQIRLTPVKGMGPGLADLIEQGDRTRVVVGMTNVPSDPAKPSLIAEIHEGACGDLVSAPLYAVENTLGGYPPAPYYVGGTLPVSLAALLSGAYSISVRTGPEMGSVELACGNIAWSSARAMEQSVHISIFAERLGLTRNELLANHHRSTDMLGTRTTQKQTTGIISPLRSKTVIVDAAVKEPTISSVTG